MNDEVEAWLVAFNKKCQEAEAKDVADQAEKDPTEQNFKREVGKWTELFRSLNKGQMTVAASKSDCVIPPR